MQSGGPKPINQKELSVMSGASQAGLSTCLSGKYGWTISQLAAVCNGLNVTIEDILLIAKELQVLKNAKHVFPRPTLVRGLELGSDERLQVLMDVAYAGNRAVAQMFDVEALKRFIPEKYEAYKNCILSDAEMYCEIVQQVEYLIKNIRLITALYNKSDISE
jgi:DNA-binding Xre family transcriptional regulator